jgi:hypothetical protein
MFFLNADIHVCAHSIYFSNTIRVVAVASLAASRAKYIPEALPAASHVAVCEPAGISLSISVVTRRPSTSNTSRRTLAVVGRSKASAVVGLNGFG